MAAIPSGMARETPACTKERFNFTGSANHCGIGIYYCCNKKYKKVQKVQESTRKFTAYCLLLTIFFSFSIFNLSTGVIIQMNGRENG